MAKIEKYGAKKFFLEDFPRTLFPLSTNKVLVEQGEETLLRFALDITNGGGSFLPQRMVHANKDLLHLRRTVKLDPVAEFYLYHLIYKNREKFRKPNRISRQHFGYRFEGGRPLPPSKSYAEFNKFAASNINKYKEFVYFDISAYFNSLYHHDLHAWFSALKPQDANDTTAFGKYLREINAGRSLDCLPQGLYPAKMIGNDFLRFMESSCAMRADRSARFMDDMYLFGSSSTELDSDFSDIQKLLGLKGLSVNASKTRHTRMPQDGELVGINELKKRLLKRRRHLIVSHYDDDDRDMGSDEGDSRLNEEEIEFVISLLKEDTLSEEDAELILIVMRDAIPRIEEHIHIFARGFPHLSKNFYGICRSATDKEAISRIVLDVLKSDDHVGEYQLFWFGMMLDNYLLDTKLSSDIINQLFKHKNATDISRAKVLEIPDLRYGLPEMREAYLREGRSDWLAWASAVGSRSMDKQARNYLLGYFKNGSKINSLIAGILQQY